MTDSELGVGDGSLDEPVPAVAGARYVGIFGWTDRHGRDRRLDIYEGAGGETNLAVYDGRPDAGGALVATLWPDGRFSWAPGQPAAAGVDTAAARNDLMTACWSVHNGL